MTSTAISAQGSKFYVGTGSGSPKTVSDVTVGYPTVITATAHGFNNGDRVTLAALTGTDAGVLNGNTYTVKYKSANTFAIEADTTGLTITAGSGTATPVTFTQVINLKTFSGFDGSASELDTTNLDSTAKEFILGLVDNGQFTIEIDADKDDASHQALQAKRGAGTRSSFKLVLPGTGANRTYTFDGFVKKFSLAGGVDQIVKSPCDIRISGPVTIS